MAEDCANPLFAEWLKEWWDVERERNTKAQLVYRKAYQAMKACTVAFQHGSEAEKLTGVGPKICRRLEDRHKEYCQENGLPLPQKPSRRNRAVVEASHDASHGTQEVSQEPPKKRQRTKEYIPSVRSGAYAIVKVLGELDQNSSQALSKQDLIDRAQPHCESSFTVPSDPTKYYTAWKSMEILLKNELVCTRGHPIKKYQLTDEGWRTALKIQEYERSQGAQPQARSSKGKAGADKTATAKCSAGARLVQNRTLESADLEVVDLSSDSDADVEPPRTPLPRLIPIKDSGPSVKQGLVLDNTPAQPIVLKSGTFEVKLMVDNREIRTTKDRDYIANELKNKHDVVADVRPLPLGDFLWVAKLKPPHDVAFQRRNNGDDEDGSTEIVLEHIIERKRLDDLISSLKDGRLHEQKFRLRKSGMRHVTYLIETVALSAERQDVYGQSIESVIAQMQIVDNIFVKQTSKMDDTIKYLARMTKLIKRKYEGKDLYVLPSRNLDIATHWKILDQLRIRSPGDAYCITFSAFCSLCDKSDSLTLRDQFLKFLMCIQGLTGERAIQIQKKWSTPRALIEAYSALGNNTEAKQTMISDHLGKEIDRKRVTKNLSSKIAEIWAC